MKGTKKKEEARGAMSVCALPCCLDSGEWGAVPASLPPRSVPAARKREIGVADHREEAARLETDWRMEMQLCNDLQRGGRQERQGEGEGRQTRRLAAGRSPLTSLGAAGVQ